MRGRRLVALMMVGVVGQSVATLGCGREGSVGEAVGWVGGEKNQE